MFSCRHLCLAGCAAIACRLWSEQFTPRGILFSPSLHQLTRVSVLVDNVNNVSIHKVSLSLRG